MKHFILVIFFIPTISYAEVTESKIPKGEGSSAYSEATPPPGYKYPADVKNAPYASPTPGSPTPRPNK